MKPLVRTNNLTKYYGKKLALKKICLNVPEGSVYGLLGLNGAGKTTTIGLLSQFIFPSSGEIFIGDLSSDKEPDIAKEFIGVLPQDASFYHNMSAIEHMVYFGRLQGLSKISAFKNGLKLLKKVGLKSYSSVKTGELSHGMRRRLGIAQALIGKPKLLILDEPTSGLDPLIAKDIRDLVVKLKKEHNTIIFCSHNLYEVEEICDYVGVLHNGMLVKESSMDDLKHLKVLTLKFTEKISGKILSVLRREAFIKSVVKKEGGLVVAFKKEDKTTELVKFLSSKKIVIKSFERGRKLEESFLDLVKKGRK